MLFRYDIVIPKCVNSAALQSDTFYIQTHVYQSRIVICSGIPYILFYSISRLRDECASTIACDTKNSDWASSHVSYNEISLQIIAAQGNRGKREN
jgi:hypothetical protein